MSNYSRVFQRIPSCCFFSSLVGNPCNIEKRMPCPKELSTHIDIDWFLFGSNNLQMVLSNKNIDLGPSSKQYDKEYFVSF